MSIVGHLSSDQIAEAKEAFSMFDRESEGEIPVDELSTVLRSLGYNCPAATLQQMIVDADPQETGKISEETFLRQVSRAEHESIQSSATAAQLEGLRDGTRFFFGGKSSGEIRRMNEEEDDTMPIDGLLYVLKAMGEKLSEEEAVELAREIRQQEQQQQAKAQTAAPQNSATQRNIHFKDLLKALGVAPRPAAAPKATEEPAVCTMSGQEGSTTGLGLGDYDSSDSETEAVQQASQGAKRGRSSRGDEEEAGKLKRITSSGTSVAVAKKMQQEGAANDEGGVKLPSVDDLFEGRLVTEGTRSAQPAAPQQQQPPQKAVLMMPPHVRRNVSNVVTEDQYALGRR
ncbi:Calcium binding protein [Perkinsus olseni]|uniref:Calmodulin n=2 Tax=Perkinsus olseni TaxID=32597 RepID=A0A7J6PNS9_PEROL|nr:Calcium binding protein [Perkinsus olseni]